MLPSLLLSTALWAPAAPVPLDTIPTPTGPAPQIAYLKADAGGDLWVNGYTVQKQKYTQSIVEVVNGKQVIKQVEREQIVPMHFRRQLNDSTVKFSTADGNDLSAAAAAKRIADGAPVLISTDGKPVQAGWLRGIHPDTVVITSTNLVGAVIQPPSPATPSTAAPRLVMLAADANGKISVVYNPSGASGDPNEQKFAGRGIVVINGQVIQRGGIDTTAGPGPNGEFPKRPLQEIKFEAYTLDGQAVPREVALERLKAGGLVVIAGDARLPDADYLKMFRGDLLVLVSPELALPASANAQTNMGIRRAVPLNVVPAAPVPLQVQPAVVPAGNLKLAPANPAPIPVQRAVPAQRAVPLPVPDEKPAQVEKPVQQDK